MSRSIRDLRDIISVSRLSIPDTYVISGSDEDDASDEVKNTLHDFISLKSFQSREESSFVTPSQQTRPGSALRRRKLETIKRPNTAPPGNHLITNIENRFGNQFRPSGDITPYSLNLYSRKYKPVPPIKKKQQDNNNTSSKIFDHILRFIDGTVINTWLECCHKHMEELSQVVLSGVNFVRFSSFFLTKLTTKQYCRLLDLEFSIFIDKLKFALHTGYNESLISEVDIEELAKSIIFEYPNILKNFETGCKTLLDILITITTQKSEKYQRLLKDIHCYTTNKQYIQWLLAIRAFGLISFINGIIKFYKCIKDNQQTETIENDVIPYKTTDIVNILNFWILKACEENEIAVVSYLYERHKVIIQNIIDQKQRNLLFVAVTKRHIDLIYYFEKLGVSVNQPNENGSSPLHYAVSKNDIELVQILLDIGADVNYRNKQSEGATSLHFSVLLGSPAIMKLLLASGADRYLAMRSIEETKTPLQLAQDLGKHEMVKILKG